MNQDFPSSKKKKSKTHPGESLFSSVNDNVIEIMETWRVNSTLQHMEINLRLPKNKTKEQSNAKARHLRKKTLLSRLPDISNAHRTDCNVLMQTWNFILQYGLQSQLLAYIKKPQFDDIYFTKLIKKREHRPLVSQRWPPSCWLPAPLPSTQCLSHFSPESKRNRSSLFQYYHIANRVIFRIRNARKTKSK